MKLNTQLRQVTSAARTEHGPVVSKLTRFTFPVATLLALVASALLTGATLATAAELVPVTLPTLLAAWVLAIGATFALPLLVVRGVVAALERHQ